MLRDVTSEDVATLIKKGITITLQEYRIERKRYCLLTTLTLPLIQRKQAFMGRLQEEAERELRRQEKEALEAAR